MAKETYHISLNVISLGLKALNSGLNINVPTVFSEGTLSSFWSFTNYLSNFINLMSSRLLAQRNSRFPALAVTKIQPLHLILLLSRAVCSAQIDLHSHGQELLWFSRISKKFHAFRAVFSAVSTVHRTPKVPLMKCRSPY